MAYKPIDDKIFINDLVNRKEFAWLNPNKNIRKINPRYDLTHLIKESNNLEFTSYQHFVKNFLNPLTPYKRLLLKWQTGTGKSIGCLAIASQFINTYKILKDKTKIGSVFILGFSSKIFKKELINFKEFGFINDSEQQMLKKLKKTAITGTATDKKNYLDTYNKIQKRLSDRDNNGFFVFYGYKSFVNRLFITSPDNNINNMSEEEMKEYIKTGKIVINEELLNQFHNSLLICDEVHNIYNSIDKNNWGMAIQYILDNIPSCRAVFASATPLNNSPTEIVDLINLLSTDKINKNLIFDGKKLKPNYDKIISKLISGKVSFVRDINPSYYPSMEIIGEDLGIKYLKFIRTPMSELQYETYKKDFKGALSYSHIYIMDFIIQSPNSTKYGIYKTEDVKKLLRSASDDWKKKYGIYYSNNVIKGPALKKSTLIKYSPKYVKMLDEISVCIEKDKGKIFIYHNSVHMSGVSFIEQVLINNGFINYTSGAVGNTICKVCGLIKNKHKISGGGRIDLNVQGKYKWNFNDIGHINFYSEIDKFRISSDEIFVNNNTNKSSEFFKEFSSLIKYLRSIKDVELKLSKVHKHFTNMYNIINDDCVEIKDDFTCIYVKSIPKKTIITRNDISRIGGNNSPTHDFIPARYALISSDVKKHEVVDILEKYNSDINKDGDNILILLGSSMMKESYDLKAIRNVFIMSRPVNIPTLLQIKGRAVRKNSHVALPLEKRNVELKLFTTCLPTKTKGVYDFSYEETKYKEKINDYITIQTIEKILNENAIDSHLNFEPVKKSLDMINYNPVIKKLNNITADTFESYKKEETNLIKYIIKRAFVEVSSVWEYNDLFKFVKDDPLNYKSSYDTNIISEDSFMVALYELQWDNDKTINNLPKSINNPDSKIISFHNNKDFVICKYVNNKKDYYILCPLFNRLAIPNIESSYRLNPKSNDNVIININSLIDKKIISNQFEDKFKIFFNKYQNIEVENMSDIVSEYDLEFHKNLAEICIKYIYNIWINNTKPSDKHEFYFKILYYYDLINLIIWGDTAPNEIINEIKTTLKNNKIKYKETSIMNTDEIAINNLSKSLNKSSDVWLKKEFREGYNNILQDSINFKGVLSLDRIPIGHYIGKIPTFYSNDVWYSNSKYVSSKKFVENNLLIGFDEKTQNGIHMRFKIRNPIQKIEKYADTRLIETGTVCKSKSKKFLIDIKNKLGIDMEDKLNVENLCYKIRQKLIRMELNERKKGSNVKYFYFHYES